MAFHRKRSISSAQLIMGGFALTILTGTFLLMLPGAVRQGSASFADALFTATSAVCVTGLVVRDTALYWSPMGQGIILALIQIGGLGIVFVVVALNFLSGRKVTLMQRQTLCDALSIPHIGNLGRQVGFILKWTVLAELFGAALLAFSFVPRFGRQGIWLSVFHSVSALCNAGFDLMGSITGPFSSLTGFSDDRIVTLTIGLLIIVGGIGFMTWEDVARHGLRFKNYRLQSKLVLSATAVLLLVPLINHLVYDFSGNVLLAAFQAVTPRTAGFNTADLNALTPNSRVLMVLLMLVGGAPGSTAGGMKVTTPAVLLLCARSVFTRREDVHCFGRRIDDSVIKSAAAILFLYVFLCVTGAMMISFAENLPITLCLFEAASAIGTVGLTLGITPELGSVSRAVLIGLMYFGRVGGLTMIFGAVPRRETVSSRLPVEKLTVG